MNIKNQIIQYLKTTSDDHTWRRVGSAICRQVEQDRNFLMGHQWSTAGHKAKIHNEDVCAKIVRDKLKSRSRDD